MLNRCSSDTQMGLWMRPAYRQGFDDGSITTLVRPGRRNDPTDVKYIPDGVDVPVRFLKQMGNRDAGLQPQLFPDDGTTVRLIDRLVTRIGELTEEMLERGSPDTATPELVRYHLALISNTGLPALGDVVTLYYIEHRPKADPEA